MKDRWNRAFVLTGIFGTLLCALLYRSREGLAAGAADLAVFGVPALERGAALLTAKKEGSFRIEPFRLVDLLPEGTDPAADRESRESSREAEREGMESTRGAGMEDGEHARGAGTESMESVWGVPEASGRELFPRMPEMFYFCSGAGGWSTELCLEDDGSFTGLFHSQDMGAVDPEEYPCGTVYICEFSGRFSAPEQAGDLICSLQVESLEYDRPGEVSVEDGVRFVTAGPCGLEEAEEVQVFLPGYPTADLPEEVLDWIRNAREFCGGVRPEELPFYVLYNVNTQEAFYSETQQ